MRASMSQCLLAIFSLVFVAPAFAADRLPSFSTLVTKAPTVLECGFESPARASERYSGRVKLTSKAELFMVVARGEEPPHECRLDLRGLNLGESSHTGELAVIGARAQACEPLLTSEMRKRLDDTVEIAVPRARTARSRPSISVIYLQGVFDCDLKVDDRAAIAVLKDKLDKGKLKYGQNVQSAEPLDTAEETAKMKKESSKR